MSINSNNIDKWLFDYYEGNLSPDDIRKLEQFLKKNPEYYEDADAWKNSFVEESVPAFSSAFLVKDIAPSGNRRKLAYVAILLLLLGTSLAIYYITPSTTSTNTGSAGQAAYAKQNTGTAFSSNTYTETILSYIQGQDRTNVNPTSVNAEQELETETVDPAVMAGLSLTPDINRLQQMANRYHASTLETEENAGFYQPTVTNRNASTAMTNQNVANTVTVSNNNIQHNAHITPTNSLVTNQQVNNTELVVNLENNGANTYEVNNTGTVALANNQQNDPQQTTITVQADPTLTAVQVDPLQKSMTEDINLTIDNNHVVAANKETTTENKEQKTAPVENNHNKENKTVTEHTSDVNPDVLLAKAQKDDEQNKSVDIDKNNKTKILPPKGLSFTNRKQVTLLQGINSEFENNASFITQHHILDAYVGGSFLTTALPGERGAGQMIGFSQYFRKAKTTVNAFGVHNKMGRIDQSGVTIQVATQFKIDRYQSIIPSLSVNATQYTFEKVPVVPTFAIVDDIPSYAAGLLTGTPVYHEFSNATKMNLSAGALYHHKKFFAGLSLNGLLQPKFGYGVNDRNYSATNYATANIVAGTDFISKKYPELSMSPQVSITVRNLEADFSGGAILRYKSLGVGAGLSSKGALNTYAGYTHRTFSLQYRFMYDKQDASFKGVNGHYLSAHFNLKSFVKKQKPILDREK